MVDIALNSVQKHGAGSLSSAIGTRESIYMNGNDIENDLRLAESMEDDETVKMLRQVPEKVMTITGKLMSSSPFINDGTRTYCVEAGGAQKASERSRQNLSDKLAAANLLPLYQPADH